MKIQESSQGKESMMGEKGGRGYHFVNAGKGKDKVATREGSSGLNVIFKGIKKPGYQ